jgi:hypothetical protein
MNRGSVQVVGRQRLAAEVPSSVHVSLLFDKLTLKQVLFGVLRVSAINNHYSDAPYSLSNHPEDGQWLH